MTRPGRFLDWSDRFGALGSLFAAACCLGLAPLVGLISAVGLGFLLDDAVLIPLLVAFLGLSLYGFWRGFRRHGNRGPLLVGAACAVGTLLFVLAWFQAIGAWLSVGGVLACSGWNVLAVRRVA